MWLCCPSAFKPAVGPKVVSEAGEPASPKAAAAEIKITIEGKLKPNLVHNGTNKTAKIGIVPKDEPIPMVINKPINKNSLAAKIFECSINGNSIFSRD